MVNGDADAASSSPAMSSTLASNHVPAMGMRRLGVRRLGVRAGEGEDGEGEEAKTAKQKKQQDAGMPSCCQWFSGPYKRMQWILDFSRRPQTEERRSALIS
jgi:hypothetical protein